MRIPLGRRQFFVGCLAAVLAPSTVPASTAAASSPQENYKKLCQTCHGTDGAGQGPVAKMLNKHPGDFTDCEAMKAHDRAFVVKIIAEGGPAVGRSSQMPGSSKKLSAEEIDALADYVMKGFCKSD